jgi:hypothetical protein
MDGRVYRPARLSDLGRPKGHYDSAVKMKMYDLAGATSDGLDNPQHLRSRVLVSLLPVVNM